MFDKLTIEDNVNECDAYHAAREHFDSLEMKNLAMWEDRIEAMERDFYLEEYKSKQLNNFIEERWHWND